MRKPRVLVLRTAGTNCDWETAHAFKLAGARPELIHVNRLISKDVKLSRYQILAFPGGFSYGDDIASGRILANEIRFKLGDILKKFLEANNPIIGICNGFQVLVKMGILPGKELFKQAVTLSYNDSDKFECRWINLRVNEKAKESKDSVWLRHLPSIISLPIAHAEGKFIAGDTTILHSLEHHNQVAFTYVDEKGKKGEYPVNPNGSVHNIAGITNDRGTVLGMMPHPERYIFSLQHPQRIGVSKDPVSGWGLQLFKNAVEYVK